MSHPDVPHPSATVSDNQRVNSERTRPILAHMGANLPQSDMVATYSDGSRIPSRDVRHDVGTPRLQHGFQVSTYTHRPLEPHTHIKEMAHDPALLKGLLFLLCFLVSCSIQ
jgi:hypothetical protein